LIVLIINAHRTRRANSLRGSEARNDGTLIRKTSLLKIVPTA